MPWSCQRPQTVFRTIFHQAAKVHAHLEASKSVSALKPSYERAKGSATSLLSVCDGSSSMRSTTSPLSLTLHQSLFHHFSFVRV